MADLNFAGPVVGQKNIAEPLNLRKDFFTASGPSWNINEDKEENLIESVSVSNEPLHIQDKTAQAIQKPAALQDRVSARVAEVEEAGTSQQQSDFAVPVTQDQWRMISTAASQSDNPDEELQRYAAALTYGREYGVDTETALQHLNEFNMHQLGKPYSPTATNTQAVVNSFKISGLAKDQGKLYEQFYNADMADQDVTGLAKQIEEYSNQIASLEDYAPRSWFIDWLKLGGKNSAYALETVGAGLAFGGAITLATGAMAAASGLTLATNGLAAPLASSVIPIAAGTITTAGVAVGTMLKAMQGDQGSLYYDLRQQGVPKNIANYAATASGMVTGVTEALFNQIGGALLRPLGVKNLSNQVTSKIFKKLAVSGSIGAVSKGLIDYFLDAGGEFGQEWIQSISRSLAEESAYAISDIVPPDKSMSILEQAFSEGLSGFAVGLLMGIPGAGIDTAYNIQEAATLKKTAKSIDSKEAFVTQMKEQKPDGITDKDWAETTSKLWENAHKSKTVSTSIQTEESATNELDYGAGKKAKGSVRRLSTGELYTKEDGTPTTDTSGAEHHRLLVGDPATGARYGHIEYAISDNTLTINDVRVKSGYENIRQESILSLAKQYPGYDIQWEAKGENLQAIKDSIIESNPRGKDAGLQYYDGVTNVDERIALDKTVKDSFTNLSASQVSAGSTLLQLAAKAKGMDTGAFINSISKDDKLFEAITSEQLGNPNAKGAVTFDQDMKALVYVTEKGDFATFVEETFHILRRTMGQTEQLQNAFKEAAKTPELIQYINDHRPIFGDRMFASMSAEDIALSLSDFTDTWTRVQEEAAAKLYLSYRSDGTVANKQLEGIFKRIAQWMNQIYQGLKHTVSINPEIAKVFDSFVTENASVTDSETVSGTEQVAQETLFQETQRQYDAVVSEYTGTEGWMKAPNGQPTNLTERQWVQVRTPAFLEWFGDWMNDPENASKVVDENGEPKVVYHNTNEQFTVFNRGEKDGLSGKGIYFSEFPLYQFGSEQMKVFLDIRNPITKNTEIEGMREINSSGIPTKMIADVLERFSDFDGVMNRSEMTVRDPSQVKSAIGNNGDFSTNPNILFQEEGRTLAVLHNISADRLVDIEALGGMPSPSIAVTRQDIDFTQFGNTTLIMDPSVAERAMVEGRLYDRDVWSPTVPRAEWKVNKKAIDKFDSKIKAMRNETNSWMGGSETFRNSDITNGLGSLVDSYKNNLSAQLTFLKEKAYDYEIKFKKPDAPAGFPIEVIEANKDYFDSNSFELETQDEIRAYLTPIIKDFYGKQFSNINSKFKRSLPKTIEDITSRNTSFSTLDQVFMFAKKHDPNKTEFDKYKTSDSIKQVIKDHDDEFTSWLRDNLKDAYSSPSIKIKGKKHSYDASSILDWMRSQNSVGSQSTMTYGPKIAGTFASEQMRNRSDVSNAEQSMVTDEDASAYYEEKITPLVDELNQKMPEYYQYSDSWESLDSIYKAIARYLKGGHKNESLSRMKTSLAKESFTKVPVHLVSTAVELAHNLANQPQDYFEAKPDRIIKLTDVKAAVIPASASTQAKEVLARNNIEAVEYSEASQQAAMVRQYIHDNGPSLLFQEENREAITEQILEDAKGFETWEGMKYYYESLYGTDMWGDTLDEAYQSDEWYQAVFNEANGISEAASKAIDPQMSPEARLADEKQKDTYIKDKLSTDEGIKAFMEKLGWVLYVGFDKSSPSMEDRQMAETVQNLRETLPELVHPTILSNAKRAGGGKALTDRAIKSIRTLMTGDSLRYYRDIYADVMEDPQLKPQVIDERLPSIESPGYNLTGFSITDRIKLADSIEAAPLKKAILSGKETLEGSAEKVIKVMDREIDDSNKQIEKLEQELKDMEDKLSESEMWHFHYAKQYSEASRSLDAEMKQIRKLTNDNMQVPEAQMKGATRLQAKVDLLHDQVMKNRASERVNATVKRHEALAELKDKLKEKQKAKDDAKKVREYKLQLARRIMVKPSDAINYDQAQLIYKLQATLDPVFRQKSMEIEIDGEQQRMTIEEAREALDGVSDEDLQMAMGQRLYERIIGERKPLNDWTVAELEETLETVADLRSEGRAILAAKQEQKQIIAQNYQDAIIRSLMATGKYTSQPLVGTKEDQKERNHPKNIARAFRYGTLAMRPKAMMLDNNTQGAAYKLLVTMKRAAQNVEWRAIERRMDPVFRVMKEHGITEKDLYKSVQISLGERMEEYTYSHLMYAWLSQFDESNRNAVAYGNLISKDEKIALDHDNDLIRELGDSRYRQLMDQVQYHLETQDESGGYMAVVKAVQEDFNAQAPRLNEIAIREFNKAMRVVEQYLPIHRKEFSGADMRQQVAEDLFNAKAGSNATGVAKGFQKDRIFISPDHQTPVNLDLMGVWNKSARQQEHFIAFAEYGRTLNRVFKNLGSRDLENAINRTLGKEMYQDVTEYINQIINPQPNNNLKGLEKGVKFMRGNLGAAYLTWKMGVLVLQAITSPMPYLSVIRADKLVKAYIGIFAHPIKSIEFINSKSAMMKNRTMNVIIDQILQESRTYTDNRLVRWNRKQQEIGSMGLTLVDRYAVAGGWLAAYEQKLNDLQSQGLVFADADAQAVIYADDIVLKTQPTGDATEIAPLFVTGSEFARAFTQFQTSLNVIWANLTYDMPQAFKKAADSSLPHEVRVQQFSQAMGTIVGYALAGALLGAVAEGHDEDDDAIDKLRNWIYWSFTQATASVPLVGDAVDNLVESAVTGDKPHVFSDEFFPGISKLFKGAVYLTQADIEKGLKSLAEGAGYLSGAPVSGLKQLKKAITEDPGALLGR